MTRPVYIADTALLCARGKSPSEVAEALWQGDCAVGEFALGERRFPYYALPLPDGDWLPRAAAATCQLREQLSDLPGSTPLFVASSSFQIGHFEQQGAPFDLPRATASFTNRLADWLQLDGPRHSFSNACISGFSAIDAASSLIACGLIDEALIVGVELSNASTVAGFAAMELLSRSTCRPCAADRDGLVLGEALAAVRLSARPGTWRIAAVRTGLDGYSTTGPDPTGGPIAGVMADTMAAAGLRPADIELLKLQAAGSPGTDLAEARALRQVFGDALPPALSLKPALGHTLGASGIAELAALLPCLEAGQIPLTANTGEPDPDIGPLFPSKRRNAPLRRALLNLIGFGGGLASLIVERTA